jgi:hypothetical protein
MLFIRYILPYTKCVGKFPALVIQGDEMKLEATDQKVQIKWFAIFSDGSKMRNSQGFVHNAWDVECSCGWATHTGGAIKASVLRDVWAHKRFEHNYQIVWAA